MHKNDSGKRIRKNTPEATNIPGTPAKINCKKRALANTVTLPEKACITAVTAAINAAGTAIFRGDILSQSFPMTTPEYPPKAAGTLMMPGINGVMAENLPWTISTPAIPLQGSASNLSFFCRHPTFFNAHAVTT